MGGAVWRPGLSTGGRKDALPANVYRNINSMCECLEISDAEKKAIVAKRRTAAKYTYKQQIRRNMRVAAFLTTARHVRCGLGERQTSSAATTGDLKRPGVAKVLCDFADGAILGSNSKADEVNGL
jgi:hypothetical protein